jgi:hypothetical protein
MPFVTLAHRENPDMSIPGDRCYVQYKKLMEQWRENPRWGTVERFLGNLFPTLGSLDRAKILAFMVFFCLEVIPYEEGKRKENGDV